MGDINENTEIMQQEMNREAIQEGICIRCLEDLGEDFQIVHKKLELLGNTNIEIRGNLISSQLLIELLDEYGKLIRSTYKDRQSEGIRKALENKYSGKGAYGRPRVELPSDFSEKIQELMRNNEGFSEYRKEINMAKSTFYKYAKLAIRNL